MSLRDSKKGGVIQKYRVDWPGKGFKCFFRGSENDPWQVFPYKWGLKALLAIQVAQEILAVTCLRPKREEKQNENKRPFP